LHRTPIIDREFDFTHSPITTLINNLLQNVTKLRGSLWPAASSLPVHIHAGLIVMTDKEEVPDFLSDENIKKAKQEAKGKKSQKKTKKPKAEATTFNALVRYFCEESSLSLILS